MQLLSCRLRQVRLHRDLELQFGPQLTVVAGPNEAGKSTLVEALHKGLFLRSTATGRGVEELRSRLHPGLPEVEICFEASGQSWQLRKRFAGSSGTCQLSHQQGLALSGAAAEEQLAQLLGVEGPVEGRRLAQLPERWAHLWVRQGEANSNPLLGHQDRYDYGRLVDQLQSRGCSEALESALDRRVLEQLQQRSASLFTATGRIKAGSPLALALQQEAEAAEELALAQQRLNDLEAAMEQLRQLGERLQQIDQVERPALQQRLQGQQQRQLLVAQRDPLAASVAQLRRALEQQRERHQLQQQLVQLEQQQQRHQRQLMQQRAERQAFEQRRQRLLQTQELAQLQLDLSQLTEEEAQLQEHQRQLHSLQSQAETLKQQLAQGPAIDAEHVRQLRRAEQDWAQAHTRCQAMAASLELLAADQPVCLNGEALQLGEVKQLSSTGELQVGAGVRLRLSPGGGDALPKAQAELERRRQALAALQLSLGVSDSDQAEAIETQRRILESELANLRKAAAAIPWSGLQERIAALAPRRQRLEAAWDKQSELRKALQTDPELRLPPPGERSALDERLQQWRQQTADLSRSLEQADANHRQLDIQEQQLQQQLNSCRGRLNQLTGALQSFSPTEDPEELETQLSTQLQQQLAQLEGLDQQLARLGSHGSSNANDDAATQLERLEQEKETLLTNRGQSEQRCASLGATDPVADLEQRQALWERAAAERQRLELQGRALQVLLERFHQAQAELSNRYSEPLRQAIGPYLQQLLPAGNLEPLLDFDPQQGFQNLQLRQHSQAFGFEHLSGGMQEQLAAALRLALAEVLQPAYDGCLPVIFDDAFTNSDRGRLAGLQRMLERGAQQGVQVVLLSCHPEDYRNSWPAAPKTAKSGVQVTWVNLDAAAEPSD
jgi:hypothetical protein